ncbi:phage portal protein [Fusibacter paucivorans]|uniref:Phage portal protein n=1 Tax=Fusibacter paucivorans TaxID=76009 RepID=A0ABS5PRR3_9FIRM|nr:phage portal protein [Fusibacter paucivorans]MBS7527848.1 phage portal protein [Fusibacter paucivorans]
MSLSAFLAQNVETTTHVEAFIASTRFKIDNEPVSWQLQSITADVDKSIRKSSTKHVPVPGKRGQFTKDTDYDLYLTKLCVACIKYPDLNSKELQDSYGVMCAEDLLGKMLLPGELNNLQMKVQEINGYSTSMDELVEEAKN